MNAVIYGSHDAVQVHVGAGAPAEGPAPAALPAGINCQTSPDGTQVTW